MKRLCLWGEFSPYPVDNDNNSNMDMDIVKHEELATAYKRMNNIKRQKQSATENQNENQNKKQYQNQNETAMIRYVRNNGRPESVEVTNRIDMIKLLIDKYACLRLGSPNVKSRMLMNTKGNTFVFTKDGKKPSPLRSTLFPQCNYSRESLTRITCALLQLSGYTEVSYSALHMLTDAINLYLTNFFESMQAAQPQPISTPKRNAYPGTAQQPYMGRTFQDGTIGVGSEETAEIRELREEYTFRAEENKNIMPSGTSASEIASGCDASEIASGSDALGIGSGCDALGAAGGSDALGAAGGSDVLGAAGSSNALGADGGYHALGAAGGSNVLGAAGGSDVYRVGSGSDVLGAAGGSDVFRVGSGYDTLGAASGLEIATKINESSGENPTEMAENDTRYTIIAAALYAGEVIDDVALANDDGNAQ